jgi:hypothetical protein
VSLSGIDCRASNPLPSQCSALPCGGTYRNVQACVRTQTRVQIIIKSRHAHAILSPSCGSNLSFGRDSSTSVRCTIHCNSPRHAGIASNANPHTTAAVALLSHLTRNILHIHVIPRISNKHMDGRNKQSCSERMFKMTLIQLVSN